MEKTFETMIEPRPEPIRETARKLRRVVFEALDDIEETIYGGIKVQNALYSKNGPQDVVCGIQTNDDYCLFYLHKTDQQTVDTGAFKLEGQGKHTRHVKFYGPEEVDPEPISRVLKQIYSIT